MGLVDQQPNLPHTQHAFFDANTLATPAITRDFDGQVRTIGGSIPGVRLGSPSQIATLSNILDLDSEKAWFAAVEGDPNWDERQLIESASEITRVGRLIMFSQRMFESSEAADYFWLTLTQLALPPNRYFDQYQATLNIDNYLKQAHNIPPLLAQDVAKDAAAEIGNMINSIEGSLGHFQQLLIILTQEPGVIDLQFLRNHLPSMPEELVLFLWEQFSKHKLHIHQDFQHRLEIAAYAMEAYMKSQVFYSGRVFPATAVEYIWNHPVSKGAVGMVLNTWFRNELPPQLVEALTSAKYFRLYEPLIQINPTIKDSDGETCSVQIPLQPDILMLPVLPEYGATKDRTDAVIFDHKTSIQIDPTQAMLYSIAGRAMASRTRPLDPNNPLNQIPKPDFEPPNLYIFGKKSSGAVSWPGNVAFYYLGLGHPEVVAVNPKDYDRAPLASRIARMHNLIKANPSLVTRATTNQGVPSFESPRPSMVGEDAWYEIDQGLFREG